MKAAFYTLGCKVNQNESSAMEEIFRRAGYRIVPPEEATDVFVVNSCTVTAQGEGKSRRALNRARQLNPQVVTVLCGCWPQAFPVTAGQSGADVLCGTQNRAHVLELVNRHLSTRQPVQQLAPLGAAQPFEELPLPAQRGRTRAFVKVQDGCNRRCAYCIIPTARGPSRSRSANSIAAELAALVQQGYREVVFTGINLPSYGRDTGTGLAALVEQAAGVPGIQRIRLSSLDPDLLRDEDIARFAAVPQLCRQFHLSLQSGCSSVLHRMRRPYTAEGYAQIAQQIRAAMPDASLTTDIIAGFPGESDDEWRQTMDFVRQMQFLKVHVFPFSAREGTPAAAMPGQLQKKEKAARAAALAALAEEVRAEWIAAHSAGVHEVLLETRLPDGRFTGYTKSYIPVALHAPGANQGDIVPVTLETYTGERCGATPHTGKPG